MSAVAELSEIDLVPAAYRQQRALVKVLHRTGVAILVVLAANAAAAAVLRHWTAAMHEQVERVSLVAAATDQHRAAVAALTERKAAIEARLGLLSGLRQPAAIDELMATVAHAVPANRMWFVSWQFERAGADAAAEPSPAPTSLVRMQMTISGQARDHGAVSEFAEALLRDPVMREVSVTRVQRDYGDSVVLFDLVVGVEMPGASP